MRIATKLLTPASCIQIPVTIVGENLNFKATNLESIILRQAKWLLQVKTVLAMLEIGLLYPNEDKNSKRAYNEMHASIKELELYGQLDKNLHKAALRLDDRLRTQSLDWIPLLSFLIERMRISLGEMRDILGEVDELASVFGKSEKLTYYENVLCVDMVTSNAQRGANWSRLRGILHAIRMKARRQSKNGRTAIIAEIPPGETVVSHGAWICATGPLARVWLTRMAIQAIEELGSDIVVRCVLFSSLPSNGRLVRSDRSTSYLGPTFWERARIFLDAKLGYAKATALMLVSGTVDGDIKGIEREVRIELGKRIFRASELERHSIGALVPHMIDLVQFEVSPKSTKRVHEMPRRPKVDVGILTVVPDEMYMVRNWLKERGGFGEAAGSRSTRKYSEGFGRLPAGESFSVAAVRALEQGNRSIMPAYRDLAEEFAPKVMVLVGIAGSIHKDVSIGDVVVADDIFYYDKRVVTKQGTQHRLLPYNLNPIVRNAINSVFDNSGDICCLNSNANDDSTKFRLHFGPIGTGEAVIRYREAEERVWLNGVNDKTLALETEAGGVAQQFVEDQLHYGYRPQAYLIVRGVSDHADCEKDDKFRQIATGNALYALEHILSPMLPLLE
ncbi:MAG: hypothetical protein K8Q91_03745 [Candidatus Vogelbacteria bacterium]|nr:hypothetical protein [Candidatus Vogelbacteria bacterium]